MATKAKSTKLKRVAEPTYVFQFLIVLPRTDPLVWRRIQVPQRYSFWDLHVAIQDAMGWKDCHLHEFVLRDTRTAREARVGIPVDDMPGERPCLPGWTVPMSRYLDRGADPVRYRYDFGDDWEHTLEFEDVLLADDGAYPRCVAGAGACPPEDVGGTHGYAEFLQAMGNPRHPEHRSLLRWAGGGFDPHAFTPAAVVFDNPQERWKMAFQQVGDGQ